MILHASPMKQMQDRIDVIIHFDYLHNWLFPPLRAGSAIDGL